jgi:N-acetylneuraminic acid mutarotase
MRFIGLLGLLVLVACGDDGMQQPLPDAAPLPLGWSDGAPVAHGAIQETAAVGVKGKIYVMGGFDSDEGIVALVQVFDTQTASWTTDGPALPRALHHVSAATDGESIYVTGALMGLNFTAVGDTYIFDSTSWKTVAAMPVGRERGAAVSGVIGGKVYVAGGFRAGTASSLVDVYDPIANTWAPLADLPIARDHACGGVMDGKLVVAGGRDGSVTGPAPDVWEYDPGTNAWTALAPMPTGRGGMACGVIDGALYTTGGEGNPNTQSGVFANVEAFDGTSWTQLAPMPHPKHGVGGAVWDGALYLCGGANVMAFGAVPTTDVFRP